MAYDADLDATFTPSVGGTPTSAYLAKVNANAAYQGAAWTSFTPAMTFSGAGSLTIGNGSITGAYKQVGKTLYVRYFLTVGSTTTFGAGDWRFGLPNSTTGIGAAATWQTLPADGYDVSVTTHHVMLGVVQGTSSVLYVVPSGSASAVTTTVPFTWATGDFLSINGVIEVS